VLGENLITTITRNGAVAMTAWVIFEWSCCNEIHNSESVTGSYVSFVKISVSIVALAVVSFKVRRTLVKSFKHEQRFYELQTVLPKNATISRPEAGLQPWWTDCNVVVGRKYGRGGRAPWRRGRACGRLASLIEPQRWGRSKDENHKKPRHPIASTLNDCQFL
jgi:hypothetical protein